MMLASASCGSVLTTSAARRPRLRHAHVERPVAQEGEAARGLVDLHRGDADIEHHAVDGRDALLREQPPMSPKRPSTRVSRPAWASARALAGGNGWGIAVDGDHPAVGGCENGAACSRRRRRCRRHRWPPSRGASASSTSVQHDGHMRLGRRERDRRSLARKIRVNKALTIQARQCPGILNKWFQIRVQPGRRKGASRPVSRVLSRAVARHWMTIHLERPLPDASRDLPGRLGRKQPWARRPAPSLFGLAPGGVCPAAAVAGRAVRSYRTISPLRQDKPGRGMFSVALSLGSPPPGVTRHRVSVEPGLSSPAPFRALRQRSSSQLAGRQVGAGRAEVK